MHGKTESMHPSCPDEDPVKPTCRLQELQVSRLWLQLATDSGGFEAGQSDTLDKPTAVSHCILGQGGTQRPHL